MSHLNQHASLVETCRCSVSISILSGLDDLLVSVGAILKTSWLILATLAEPPLAETPIVVAEDPNENENRRSCVFLNKKCRFLLLHRDTPGPESCVSLLCLPLTGAEKLGHMFTSQPGSRPLISTVTEMDNDG